MENNQNTQNSETENQFEETQEESCPPFDSKSIYLRKDGNIVGLHSIGENDSYWTIKELDGTEHQKTGFRAIESWGNNYDENYKMIGRGSFRVFKDIEKEAKEFEEDGWIRFPGPQNGEL